MNVSSQQYLTCSIIIPGSGKTPAQLGYLPRCLVDRDNVARLHFLLDGRLDHLGAQVVDGLHFGGLEGQLADLGAGAGGWPVNLNLDNLALNHLRLLADPHPDAFPDVIQNLYSTFI